MCLNLSHPDELAPGRISSGWLMASAEWHPDDLRCCPMSFRWHNVIGNLGHPDEIAPGCISSGWLMTNAGCHPDDLRFCPGIRWHNVIWALSLRDKLAPGRMSSGWLMTNAGCHPDDLWCPYLIRMTNDQRRISSGWLTMFPYMSSGWQRIFEP